MENTDLSRMVAALDRLAEQGFVTGDEWEAAHMICQAHEGERVFDWGHAFCHRIEGDTGNAAYWYRRAGNATARGSFDDEWSAMRAKLTRGG